MSEDKLIKICALTTISKTMDWFVVDSMRNLSNNGYDVTLICNMDDGFAQRNEDYATCIDIPMSRGVSVKDLVTVPIKLAKIFKKNNFDIVYYTSPNVSLYASIGGLLAGVKNRVYSQCGLRYVSFTGTKRKIFKLVEKLTCKMSTTVRSQSPLNMKFAVEEGLCKAEKISVVGIGGTTGVSLKDCDCFDHEETKKKLRTKYSIPQNAFLYGYVGRINADKGINELIEAFKSVLKNNDTVYLALVGMLDDTNPINDDNLEYAQSNEHIVLTGNVPPDEVYKHMSMFDVLVHPTYREGFGKVLQEAMGVGIPIITTDIPGPSEVVENGISGLLVKVKNIDSLKTGMEKILNDNELRENMAKAGRQRAEKYFDRPIMLNNILLDLNKTMGVEK
ncbi:MAG: glycosyltransferase family 4 protein [Erysipelotrichia bacterium]|nr:glycosyltransferase family 4 protein [Erysipelotrichia bacterium]